MIREIFKLGNPKLYEVCENVTPADRVLLSGWITDLHDTLMNYKETYGAGRAIAAPQIGVQKRLIYMNIDRPYVFINPVLTFPDEEKFILMDDCMSFPGLIIRVERYRRVDVAYLDESFHPQVIHFDGAASELIQHEFDHLNGILATMRAVDQKPTPRNDILIRPEKSSDYLDIIRLVLRSFSEGTDYSDGTDVLAFIEEIRESEFYIPNLSFVAELNGEIVGHFMFSHFPISKTKTGGHGKASDTDVVMLAPVAVKADYFRCGIGTTMLTLGIEQVKNRGFKGILVEGNNEFYNKLGFKTSSEYNIFPTSGRPLDEPRFMMCMETYKSSLSGIRGYIVYDMYYNT